VLLLALPAEDGPHVLAAWQLKCCDHLGPDCLLQEAESTILAMACRGHQLYVRVRGRGAAELLGQEGWLPHGHLPAWPDVQETVHHLKSKSCDLMSSCLLPPVHFKISIHLQLSVQPVSLHVQPLLLAGWLPLHPPGLPHLPAGESQQE